MALVIRSYFQLFTLVCIHTPFKGWGLSTSETYKKREVEILMFYVEMCRSVLNLHTHLFTISNVA